MNKNELTHSHSKSLWNYTLSPGWTDDEVFILKLALQKFGVGRWQRIVRSGCLPRKSVAQIYLQTQRIMGQQSLGGTSKVVTLDFMGLHVDIERIFLDNMKIKNVLRKNNCIINTGDNPTQDERSRKKQENRDRYGLSKQYVKEIKLPRENMSQFKDVVPIDDIDAEKLTTIEQIHLLNELRKAVDFKIQLLGKRGEEEYKPTFKNRGVMAPLKVDYWRIEKTPVIINLAKDDHGGYSVLQD